ncbi:Gldg family protein [Kiritimatiellaeota bacterium B1221]|nr:Gldg family protein [Kiritimatiellaeota bacterium B1221]
MKYLGKIFRKEFNAYFSSPAAWLFMGTFLLVTLFVFFWAEAFFARNIADMKPLFQWIPVLLIFLVGTLSMRTWSEERRSGTIESLLTSPAGLFQIVAGKFLANLALVALALTLTLPLSFSVSRMGPMDWGPVMGGYVASLFLAAAYVAIGLYMSGRTDNPIVALILTVSCTGCFYLLGSDLLTTLFGHRVSGVLELIGSGSRFESITRGVLDLRDIYYYLSIVGVFLALNLYSLERLRRVGNPCQSRYLQSLFITLLAVANLLAANFWLTGVGRVRIDLTEGRSYSLSSATRNYIAQAKEPLLIRGYFSQKSHPLLEPLVPQLRDLLEEYQVAGGSKLQVEFVDPQHDREIEAEAAEKYGIRPVPFRMASRYESGVVNSYFDLLVSYGGEYEVLSFDDLIEVKMSNRGNPEVRLNNPEYAVTRAIRKVIGSYRAGGDVYRDLPEAVRFKAYVSPAEKLPEAFAEFREVLEETLENETKKSGGRFSFAFEDPDAGSGELGRQLNREYGFMPQIAGLFDTRPFWFYMVLEGDRESVQIPLPDELSANRLENQIQSALKRMAPGYMKSVAVVTPKAAPQNPYLPAPAGKTYNHLRTVLEENVRVIDADLSEGTVPADADMLMVLAPEKFTQKEVFAVDQFLMQGGTVVVASSPYDVSLSNRLSVEPHHSGLEDWLAHMGVTIQKEMVLDPQNASLPLPVPRRVGPISVNEIVMMPYPHFPDLREDGLDAEHPVVAGLNQLSFNWVSPVRADTGPGGDRKVVALAKSSPRSWTSDDINVMPNYQVYPRNGFLAESLRARQPLAVVSQGRFRSYFEGKDSPLLPENQQAASSEEQEEDGAENKENPVYGSVIQRSSDSARLVVIGSNSFAEDMSLGIASQGLGTEYTAPLTFMQNLVDWSLDDAGLLRIRGRAQFARTLNPMTDTRRRIWEYGNYAVACLGLVLIGLVRKIFERRKHKQYKQILAEV